MRFVPRGPDHRSEGERPDGERGERVRSSGTESEFEAEATRRWSRPHRRWLEDIGWRAWSVLRTRDSWSPEGVASVLYAFIGNSCPFCDRLH